mmetsp:Transcript_21956/g.62539  ORF Transcript_21956/g.62539 Transcript_21956/m.62539 type:complete len:745 (+) Transcript_21956:3-2237(+)
MYFGPVLIIPGFMSSGLQITESTRKPKWVNERIWINLQSLGMQSMYFGPSTVTVREADGELKEKGQKDLESTGHDSQHEEGENDGSDRPPASSKEKEEARNRKFKSQWLEHMILQSDMRSEAPGVKIRNIEGLEGVDYLSPGMLTDHVSYVFGPVINALVDQGGYTRDVNLQAAPYDWRMSPTELESRDKYFSRTIQQVASLYHSNNDTPVVLIGHSLGTKTAHYFLNFCLKEKGREWIDKYIHTYMPVGGPHLGAPKALRSTISGDKMSLDTFLSDEEALSFGRSLGSGPWLFPGKLPAGATASAYVQPQGIMEINFKGSSQVEQLIKERTAYSKPKSFQLQVVFGSEKQRVSTPLVMKESKTGPDSVSFVSDTMFFGTAPYVTNDLKNTQVQLFLREPGLGAAKYEEQEKQSGSMCCCILKCITCCWIFDMLFKIFFGMVKVTYMGFLVSADAIMSSAGGTSVLAFSEAIKLDGKVWNKPGEAWTVNVQLFHKHDYGRYEAAFMCFCKKPLPARQSSVQVEFRWKPYSPAPSTVPDNRLCSSIGELNYPHPLKITGKHTDENDPNTQYQAMSGYDMLHREGLNSILANIKTIFDDNTELDPRGKSSLDVPPVNRVHAIYGINLPTEVAAVYKRKDLCVATTHTQSNFTLDKNAKVPRDSGYKLSGGVLFETKDARQSCADGRQTSGDGTVPYWSLCHVKTWKDQIDDVTVVELDKAEHREILADARFHKAVIDYCRTEVETA